MASWLKAAEDLFEVVDRRAKLVVGEKSDEQPNFQAPVSNGQGSQAKRTRPKKKAQKRTLSDEALAVVGTENENTTLERSVSDATSDREKSVQSSENREISLTTSDSEIKTEELLNSNGDGPTPMSGASPLENVSDGKENYDVNHMAVIESLADGEPTASNSNVEHMNENLVDVPLSPDHKGVENLQVDAPHDSDCIIASHNQESPNSTEQNDSESGTGNEPGNIGSPLKDTDLTVESTIDQKPQVQKDLTSPTKVQEQLDEAQGLLKSTNSTGQSKEARLARVCAGLSSRLQEYKSENAQLEELLVAERELSRSYEERLKQLQKDLTASKTEVSRVESSMAEALGAKNAEIEALINSVDALKKQAASAEGNLASLQANMESILRSRELTETRMMQALREELATAERRAEEERAAHSATKMAAMEREVELEQRSIEASTALARIQRAADERTAKAAELEQKVALLEVECASLNQELQDMEARFRRGQKKTPEDGNQMIQMQAWQEEVERARQGQREAESKLSSMEAEVQKMRVEMAAMKRDAEHYSRQEHMELEKRYRELTDLLYYKQTQLETMASEKAAAEFQLEKELKRFQEAQAEAERNRVSRRASSSWEEDTDIKALEPLPLHHRHMVGAGIQLQKAAKLLDTGAVRATRFLWRYPTARIILLFYLVFVHLFLMYLLHRLQEQADIFAAKEFAESMGLANQTLP